jgi:hypothetical protein
MAESILLHEEMYDDLAALRGLVRRQARDLATLRNDVTALTATVATLLERAMPRGTWVEDELTPPEWLPDDEDHEPPLEPQPVFIPLEVASGR